MLTIENPIIRTKDSLTVRVVIGSLIIWSFVFVAGEGGIRSARAQIAQNVPAEAFVPQLNATFDRLKQLESVGSRTLLLPGPDACTAEARCVPITVQWRDGVDHVSIAPQDSPCSVDPAAPPDEQCQFTSFVFDLANRHGVVTEQVWIGLFNDMEPVLDENGFVVGVNEDTAGLITGTPGGAYLMVGVISPDDVAHWAMFGLTSAPWPALRRRAAPASV